MEPKRILWISAISEPRPAPPCGGWLVERTAPAPGIERLSGADFDAVVLEPPLPDWTAAELLEQVQRLAPEVPVLVCEAGVTVADAVRLGRLGVCQFLAEGPPAFSRIEEAIEARRTRGLARLAESLGNDEWDRLLVGGSRQMRQVSHLIRLVGPRRCTVLITGETGTGKEIAARALHLASPRRRAAMVAVNCSALPENLLEAELFGHVKGAFTGAVQNRVGRFEQAQGGTLLLDEIGELPLDLQAKLLRVLQEREYQRLGSSETVQADVRVVAATNCDLAQKIEQGRFREDLFYRLNVVPVHMPSLRERKADVPLLAAHFVEKVCRLEEISIKSLTPEAVERLESYSWPGNVRQLENAVEMAVALSGDHPLLIPADFPLPAPARAKLSEACSDPFVSVPDSGLDFEQTLTRIERSILEQALQKTGGNKKAAAQMLRLKRTTLSAKVRSLEAATGCS